MISVYLYWLIGLGLLFPILTLFYINRIKSVFSHVSRLERPWVLLEVGVALLFASLLTTATSDGLGLANGLLRPAGNLLLILAAFFILWAMVTMKRVWTISESD
jgi:hypothetical protein